MWMSINSEFDKSIISTNWQLSKQTEPSNVTHSKKVCFKFRWSARAKTLNELSMKSNWKSSISGCPSHFDQYRTYFGPFFVPFILCHQFGFFLRILKSIIHQILCQPKCALTHCIALHCIAHSAWKSVKEPLLINNFVSVKLRSRIHLRKTWIMFVVL